jgi:hypothetical protein
MGSKSPRNPSRSQGAERSSWRTLAHFDVWNPARGTPAELRTRIDELNKERADDQSPLRLFFRSFAQRPGQPAGDGVPGLAGVVADVRAAVEADVEEVIVDCNFWTGIDCLRAWAEIPERLLPALRAAPRLRSSGGPG